MASTYQFKTRPYRHQYRAVKQLLQQGYGGALLMEPRTGKTKTAIDWVSILYQKKKLDRVMIVCPNRVMGTWLSEFQIHCPFPTSITLWDKDERKLGPPRILPGALNVLIVNYEAFATPGKKLRSGRRSKASGRFKTRSWVWKWIDGKPAAAILDESHKIKSPSSKAASMLVSMAPNFKFRTILTGTPITKANRAFDIYMQWQFLNPRRFADLPTAAEFKSHFGVWIQAGKSGGASYPKFVRPKNMAELQERISEDSVIVRRDQCFDLPPREDLIKYVELSPGTRKVYDTMAKEMVVEILEGVYAEAPIKLVQSLRLSQITSGFIVDEDKKMHRLGFEKANVLEELYADRFELDEKIVVAARYKADLDTARDLARSFDVPVWEIRGDVSRKDSDEGIRRFSKHDGAAVMVVQPAAAALGIDLSTASHMVWYSHTPSWVNFSQCCDRIALSRTSTTFTHLIVKRSVDEILLSVLAGDGDVAKAIMMNPRELINGHPLDLDDSDRLKGLGDFQFRKGKK